MMTNLFDRAKLLFRKDKELCLSLYKILGFYPHDIELYRIALSHKSSQYISGEKGRPLNNERLEFLGDAILEAVTSDIIFHRYERKREGFLTTTRSKLVQRDTLNRLAKETGLDALIRKNTTGHTHNNYLGGNAFEALVGAVYLDRGYRHCHWFVSHRIIGKLVDLDDMARKEVNFKSKLLEWSQKNRIQLEFKLDESIDTTGNSPEFRSYAILEGVTAGEGKGFSKKESHQQASKEALMKLRREPQFIDRILRSKEKRTAMEADVFAAVPKIDEIENELKKDKRTSAGSTVDGRPAKPVKRRSRNEARRAAARTENAPTAAPADATPHNKATATQRNAEAAKEKATATQRNAEAAKEKATATQRNAEAVKEKATATQRNAEATTTTNAPLTADRAGETSASSSAGRRRRRRPATAGISRFEREEGSREAADHEAIIRAAEEAAFKEQAL